MGRPSLIKRTADEVLNRQFREVPDQELFRYFKGSTKVLYNHTYTLVYYNQEPVGGQPATEMIVVFPKDLETSSRLGAKEKNRIRLYFVDGQFTKWEWGVTLMHWPLNASDNYLVYSILNVVRSHQS